MKMNPYLTFHTNCREAMQFYKKCFGGTLRIIAFGDMPAAGEIPPEAKDNVMHASLVNGDFVLMASDSMQGEPKPGDTMSMIVNCKSVKETQKLFGALSENAHITAPLHESSWAAQFGMLTDKFGMQWMLNCDFPPKKAAPKKGNTKAKAKAKPAAKAKPKAKAKAKKAKAPAKKKKK